jgi:hypothetical protein
MEKNAAAPVIRQPFERLMRAVNGSVVDEE